MAKKEEKAVAARGVASSKSATGRGVATGKAETSTVHYNKTEGQKMSRKDKKIEKKLSKFNERDLRSYPMTVWKWIGTYILLAIPFVNAICCICWFFGVGNKSRAAWIRSYVVRFLIVVVLIVALIGCSWLVLKNMASKNAGAESNEEVIFFAVSQFADIIGGIAGQETAEMIKSMVAEKLGIEYESQYQGENNDSSGGGDYGDYGDGYNDGYNDGYDYGYGY